MSAPEMLPVKGRHRHRRAGIELDLVPSTAPINLYRSSAHPKISDVIAGVCEAFSISRADLISQRRTLNVVMPRQIAMYLAKVLTLRSLPSIGQQFGGRDHTTILHGIRKIEGLIATDAALAAEVEAISLKIEGRAP